MELFKFQEKLIMLLGLLSMMFPIFILKLKISMMMIKVIKVLLCQNYNDFGPHYDDLGQCLFLEMYNYSVFVLNLFADKPHGAIRY
ncbi:hypothetical protein RhiirA1_412380 [Rhizophagus irregularis]|uniref:Uncharacterized protein n=1 Tax=Rhizophagus irregularis TaxID=588596 RepID=A0A2N0S8V7_9GLOM|nr:hypothetical protein RhiirA1_412380 [Rhizophagus irregularis]